MSKLPIHRAARSKSKDKITRGLGSLPQVEMLRPWRGYPVGARIRPPGVLRQVLLQQNIAALVSDKPKKSAPKKVSPKVEEPKAEVVKEEVATAEATEADKEDE